MVIRSTTSAVIYPTRTTPSQSLTSHRHHPYIASQIRHRSSEESDGGGYRRSNRPGTVFGKVTSDASGKEGLRLFAATLSTSVKAASTLFYGQNKHVAGLTLRQQLLLPPLFLVLLDNIGSSRPQDTQSQQWWNEFVIKFGVLDLSFNDFKGPGFEPLGNCKALQVTSLKSLPKLPNLEVLAASKNKISTLKGFPHLPALEHLRVEENPILMMSHLEAAAILLIGLTLKKFNVSEISPDFRNLDIKELCAAANTDEDIDEEADDCEDDNLVDSESHDTDDQ
ncbi:hypothetical protein OROMI_006787 [Orobanche minor]